MQNEALSQMSSFLNICRIHGEKNLLISVPRSMTWLKMLPAVQAAQLLSAALSSWSSNCQADLNLPRQFSWMAFLFTKVILQRIWFVSKCTCQSLAKWVIVRYLYVGILFQKRKTEAFHLCNLIHSSWKTVWFRNLLYPDFHVSQITWY